MKHVNDIRSSFCADYLNQLKTSSIKTAVDNHILTSAKIRDIVSSHPLILKTIYHKVLSTDNVRKFYDQSKALVQ
jgi:hypothetical protein